MLHIEIGDITRFDSVEKLAAYAGLDPQIEQSSDLTFEKGISKKGNRYIRAILYVWVRDCRNPWSEQSSRATPRRSVEGKRKAPGGPEVAWALGSWRSSTAAVLTESGSILSTKSA